MITAVICTYNRCNSLRETLKSLQGMPVPPAKGWELIVVDNNSTDATRAVVEEFESKRELPLRYVFEARQGLSSARNTGIHEARGDVIVFTDDDVIVDPHWLAHIESAFEQLDCAAVGGRIVPVWPGAKPAWFQEEGQFATPKAIVSFNLGNEVCEPKTSPYGANMAFRRRVFEERGLFRTDLGRTKDVLMGGEDIEFFRRLKKAGDKVLYIPDALVYHPVAAERTRQSYFQSWCFNAARSQVRLEGFPRIMVFYLRVPRYLFRSLIENTVKWLVSVEPKRRFYYKLQLYIVAGTILEARKLRR